MIAMWMMYGAVLGGLLIVAADALEYAARAMRRPVRLIWAAALLATVLVPLAALLKSPAPTGNGAIGAGASFDAGFMRGSGTDAGPIELLNILGAGLDRPLMIAWAMLSLLLVGRVCIGLASLWRQRHRWIPREIDGTPIFVTPDIGPAVVAIPDSRIVLPEWALRLDPESLATVISHERQHRAAGDVRLILAASIAAALLPWNPALWYIRRRLRLAIEMDCDARVLAEGPQVDEYGSTLLAIAGHPRRALHLGATLTESATDLERRIDAMTAQPPRRPRIRAAALILGAVAMVAVACSMDAPDLPSATGSRPQKSEANTTYMEFQIEKPAAVLSSSKPPIYPAALRMAGIEGQVVAQFVVDTNGRIEPRTFEVRSSDRDEFAEAVRQNLSGIRFSPARVGGRPVRQLVRMPFAFSLSKGTSGAVIRK